MKLRNTLIGGITGTVIMTIFGYLAPFMGLPGMNPAEMLSMMMGVPNIVGWIMHFMIGIIFAAFYFYLFINWLKKMDSKWLRGIVFGIIIFIIAQIAMGVMGAIMGGMPEPENMMLMMIASLLGHIVYGIGVVLPAKEQGDKAK
ncbi:MAG: hypothetical protein H0V01_10585 [Bacteroidetes bacterium]|nr:hypothetical protein [Bacteroidota bacterium]HET6243139.1 DUF6789 family protein [Bacteroidia bacterium]